MLTVGRALAICRSIKKEANANEAKEINSDNFTGTKR